MKFHWRIQPQQHFIRMWKSKQEFTTIKAYIAIFRFFVEYAKTNNLYHRLGPIVDPIVLGYFLGSRVQKSPRYDRFAYDWTAIMFSLNLLDYDCTHLRTNVVLTNMKKQFKKLFGKIDDPCSARY